MTGGRRRAQSAGYRAAWWLPDPHTATLWGRVGRREPLLSAEAPMGRALPVHLEQWEMPDGDFVEVARMASSAGPTAPRILLLHGLEGGLHSHYARAMFREARSRGWAADLLLFRTCGPTPNRLPRSYHSGETSDPQRVIERILAEFPDAPLGLVGVSLGGNVLCKLLGEQGDAVPAQVVGAVAMSVPYCLSRASDHIGRGFGTLYVKSFMRSLVPKALNKIARLEAQHPELASLRRVAEARTLRDFDDQFTAPLHGFDDAEDYYTRSSALHFVGGIRRPTLLLNAVDDPFIPPSVLDDVRDAVAGNDAVTTEFPARGGHVGFTAGRWPWSAFYYGEWRAAEFLGVQFAERAVSAK